MQRVLKATPVTLSVGFQVDGEDTDPSPDIATVTVTRDDGTVLVNAATATPTGTGGFLYTLSAAQNDRLDVLTAEWTSALGTLRTVTEIVGGFLFTVAQAKALSGLASKTTQQIIDARTLVETAIEDACGVAFVPRYKRESLSGLGFTQAILSMPRVTAVRSLTLDGAAVTDAASVVPSGSGAIHYPAGFTRGFGNYEVAYEHGWPSPPPRVSQAALRWARSILIDGPIDDRYTSVSNDVGTFSLATPGLRGSVSGLPEVDATIAAYSLRACVA